MKKSALFLALLLMVSLGGCTNNEDLTDTLTQGTWRVSYFIMSGDEDTSLFNGYIFTFLTDGTVTVTRPGAPPAQGTWNGFDSDTRFDLDFTDTGLLQRLDESWAVDKINDDEIFLHEVGSLFNQLELRQR
jgi:hypothetical protein